jgi:cytochrome d ubiquinol oxidase subunit I
MDVVSLSRLQFGLTALYHFLFVPLTLGLSLLLAIMESVWVMTGRTIWRDMTKFWGNLFGINFAMGVATGITMEFQFGTNWAYYSHYVGDIFGVPLAIEGMMAFFLEATFVGLFFFGWDKLSRFQHLMCTWLVALGANLSALWILIANGWMQNPIGAHFNIDTMRMEVSSFADVMLNPVAQDKFVHTVGAGYVTGSIFVLAISAWYLLNWRHVELAKRSMTVAICFGLASALSVVVLGDESGYTAGQNQKMKIAAIEAVWQTQEAPAGLTVFGWPDRERRTTQFEIKLPWLLGLIATRSFDTVIPGIDELVDNNKIRIRNGMIAYDALDQLRHDRGNLALLDLFNAHQQDLGYALLLKRYTDDVAHADEHMIDAAADDTVPNIPVLFWSFRVMVALGFYFIALFAIGFIFASKRRLEYKKVYLRIALLSLPLPWISSELGWVVAEMGRQPWTIDGVLPTFLSASSTTAANVWFTLGGFALFYSALFIVEIYLMIKYVTIGPKQSKPDLLHDGIAYLKGRF